MNDHREKLPLVLFELSVMRETVRAFGPDGATDASRLLAKLAVLESKAWRLIEVQGRENRSPHDH